MDILIIGGTIFLGRSIVEAALARGHRLTLFNRGKHNPEWFPEVEKIQGDRDGGLDALAGRRWDAVIDTCGYLPRIVRASAELLAPSVGHYTFISSISVYADFTQPDNAEDAPLATLSDPNIEQITGESYGGLKALCEQAAEAAMPGRTLNVRAGLIVGPYDLSDRFTYWPYRVAQGGPVLAPAPADQPVQFIDVRDLAAWIVHAVEAKLTGPYNATGPNTPLSFEALLDACRAESSSDATFVWADEDFILAQGIQPWMELPLWVSGTENAGASRFNCAKAQAAGLVTRAVEETVCDTLAWDASRPADLVRRAGLPRERETAALAAWAARA